jgi:hypothetical protein
MIPHLTREPLVVVDGFCLWAGVAVTALAGLLGGWSVALSVGAGAVLSYANLRAIRALASRAVTGQGGGAAARFVVSLVGKMVALLALSWAAIRLFGLDPLAFGVGTSTLAFALLGSGLWLGLRQEAT